MGGWTRGRIVQKGWMDKWTDARTGRRKDGRRNVRKEGRNDGWNRWMYGRVDGWTDGLIVHGGLMGGWD